MDNVAEKENTDPNDIREEEPIEQPVKKTKVTATKVKVLTQRQIDALARGREKLRQINEEKQSQGSDTLHIISRIEKIESENAKMRDTVLKTKLQQLEEEQEVLKEMEESDERSRSPSPPPVKLPRVPVVPNTNLRNLVPKPAPITKQSNKIGFTFL